MDKEQIKREIERALNLNSETELVEFKDASGGFPKTPVRKTLSAFGNTRGGIIVFGIKENQGRKLDVVELDNFADLQERMTTLSSTEMNIVLRLDYHYIEIDSKTILAIYVPPVRNSDKPYYFKELGMPKGAFVRDSNTDRQMTEDEVRSYVRNAQIDDFDNTCINEIEVEELSDKKIKSFFETSAKKTGRVIKKEISNYTLENIGIITKCGDEQYHPTLAGYLIFAKDTPQEKLRFERYKIRCVRFKGSGVSSPIIDKADIIGTLDEQIDLAESFILRNIKTSAEIVGTKRVERFEYPQEAIREIVANAVIHRDYRITETYTQINIFEDRIEVFNPGNLPPGVTVENIKYAQESRNKIIAGRLNEMDYLEEYGRGIDIVFDKMSEWRLLPPIFKNSSNSFKVILPGEKLSQLNERQMRIWEFLLDKHKITRKEVEELLSDIPQATISSDLLKMQTVGLIDKQGMSKNTHYVSKF